MISRAGASPNPIIVEQQIDNAPAMADRGVIMKRGEISLTGRIEDLRQDKRVRAIYLGLEENDA
jgi:ABC-type branched-subunit amino acid transport system ATPase component